MTFGASYWLWALALLPVIAWLFIMNEQRRKALLQKIVAARLLDRLAGSMSPGKRRLRFGVLLLGLASIIASLAQPRIGYTWEESKRKGRDVLIAIDTSKSMLSNDVAPNRLARAKLAAQDLVGTLGGDRAGVIAFAGSTFLQAPLTIDYGAVIDSINDLDTNTIPLGGTNIAAVIDAAAKAFGKGESENRCLVLFTDGEELDADGVAAARRQTGNFRIFTVGVGTQAGAIIPVTSGEEGTSFVKDQEGQIVKSRLDENRLKEIAEATGGFYTHLQHGPEDMKKIVQDGLGKIKEHDIDARMSRHPIERYQWPLGFGILLIAISMLIKERRRMPVAAKAAKALKPAVALLTLWIGLHSANALPVNEGLDLYNNKKYKESYNSFSGQLQRNPDSQALEFDSGAAAYKNGDYDKAIESFGRAIGSPKPTMRAKSEYNLGNALCLRGVKQESKESKLKDWNNALQHYDEALKIDPKNEDAKYNRDVVEKLIEELKKEPPQSKDDKKQDKDQKKDDQKDRKDKQDQQKQNQKDKQDKKDQKDQKKDDQNSGQGKDKDQQQQKQDGKDSKDQNKQDSKDQNGSKNDQSKQDQNQQSQSKDGQDQKKDQPGSEGKDQKQDQNQGQPQNPSPDKGNDSQNQQSQQASQQPTPGKGEPEKKYSGPIKEGQQQPGQKAEEGQTGEPEKAYVPGEQREMTAAEAVRIVESEKGEEAKGVLIEHKASAPVLKDW